jgi:hypothetical protein
VCLSGSWAKLTIGTKARLEMSTMSLDELVGRLLMAEERCGGVEAVANGVRCLLLMEEQWGACRRC